MRLRQRNLAALEERVFDVLVVGGGINGAVSAAALAAKGAKVALIDRGDFGGLVSQSSSNLAWGGIKYLESFELSLVRKLCLSRNRLMRAYPATVQEIRFFTVLERGFRHHRLTLFLGTLLYWLMGNVRTRAPRLLSNRRIGAEEPAVRATDLQGGVEYSDAYFHDNDARFVFNFVRSALDYGCIAANYVESAGAARAADGLWHVQAHDRLAAGSLTVRAKVLLNACGPLADDYNERCHIHTATHHVLSKGVHLLVPCLSRQRRVLTFFADDGRMFFAVPMGARTCIGTTDSRVTTATPTATDEDIEFILRNINQRLTLPQPLQRRDILAVRCGVRPLAVQRGNDSKPDDWTQLSRKHVLEAQAASKQLTIFGGKLTDCLNVGDEVCQQIERLGIELAHDDHPWYGEAPRSVRDEFYRQAQGLELDRWTAEYASEPLTDRLWRRYGGHAIGMLEEIRQDPSQAAPLIEGSEYARCEIEQAARREMVSKLDDFLRRRAKIAWVVPHEHLRQSQGLREACRIFFGDQAEAKWQEYFSAPGERATQNADAKVETHAH